ncbi:alpha-xylosidase [Globicatella sulfidifaciens]|uniref:alpha-D-xyloside xylohydrolase n=1 Tax=Globicatella sulfidifaciens DSM 15739 TaxID=1121925 RepID=A0A1T4MVW2_9LACT|nr:alpha-xylosidase [Globicatella sulfidifaciens]SJZ70986.1 alpha-D-xyloside xylohydrolase [Globicatella sulfidifaciens DSM 15739]
MKYSDGGWLVKEGFEVSYPAHVYTTRQTKEKLTLFAPFRYTSHKGYSLDGGMMTIEISAPAPNIIGVKAYHHKGVVDRFPKFELNTETVDVEISETEEHYIFTNGKMSLEVAKGEQFHLVFKYEGRILTESKPRGQAYIIDNFGKPHISEQLTIGVGESIYGLGERFTSFVKNGQTVDMWNADGGTGTEQSYKNIPFYVSNNRYGIFVNSSNKVSFEVGSEKVSRVQFSNPGESLEYFVVGGQTIKDVLKNYTNLVGKPGLPPTWSYGLWLSTSFLTDYDEETVNQFVDGMVERDIPLEVFHFDCLWMEEFEWVNFTWDPRMFPDPEGMLSRLKAKGLKICVWINPYVAQKSIMFDEGMEKGYFLKRENGDVWQWDKWQAGQAIVDFTNPEATKWYVDKLEALIDMGVDSFKTDFGERIPTDCVYFDGSDPDYMHNYYTQIYNEVVYQLLERKLGKNEAVLFARSATVGGQKFPVHWGGDNTADYPSMAESLRAGLSFGLSGFGYWSHDIGGFESGCQPDIYKRWTQFGLLSSHSRYHGSWEYKVPWLFGEEAVEVTRKFTKLKLSLMPYLIAESNYTHETGVPMMRAMIIDFEQDLNTHTLDRQYMLGSNLLVAPIFNEEGIVQFYVPNGGTWTNYLTGELYLGGKWYTQKYDYFGLPLLARPNSIIIEGNVNSHAVYDFNKGFTAHWFEPSENIASEASIYNQESELVATLKAINTGGKFQVDLSGDAEGKLMIHIKNKVKTFELTNGSQTFEI